jgi:hypothetical protein
MFDRILVLNAGPGDDTLAEVAAGLEVIPLAGSDALRLVADTNLAIEQDNLVFFAADGRQNPRDVGRLLLALERGHDMVIASRFVVGGDRRRADQMNPYRSIGNRVFTLLANLLFYGNLSDCLSQLRAVKRSKLAGLGLAGQGLPLVYRLSIRAIKAGWRVTEIPTTEYVNPKLDNFQQIVMSIIPVFVALIAEWFRKEPPRN